MIIKVFGRLPGCMAGMVICMATYFFPVTAYSQENAGITFDLKDGGGEKFYLYGYRTDKKQLLDSATADIRGTVFFPGDRTPVPGTYHLQADKERGLDFLADGNKIHITAGHDLSQAGLQVLASESNRIYFEYVRRKEDHRLRMDLLTMLLLNYPEKDTFYALTIAEAQRVDSDFQAFLSRILSEDPNSMVSRIIRFNELELIIPDRLSPSQREFLKSHYFDGIDLSDTLWLHTRELPGKVVNYLSLFVVPGGSREKQEILFIAAADSLMKFTAGSPEVQAAVAGYLTDGFQAYGFEKVLQHIVENYMLGNSCVSEEEESKLKLRMEGFRKLAAGNPAPDFEETEARGKQIRLSRMGEDMRLLFFWSSDCPHCEAILPGLKALWSEYRGKLGIIGISVDKDEAAWRKALADKELPWSNIAELQGWDGPIVKAYYIYATPTFLLVDRDMKIVAKPLNVAEIRSFIGKR